ncbi:peptide-methionine (S)-S-oxide reductase MsrA [bacterium]|nr:peptide-methionine (S)-S-oxide reductase MsrA [bacterium]
MTRMGKLFATIATVLAFGFAAHAAETATMKSGASEETQKAKKTADAYFAGGCFWGVEYYFDKEPGVIAAQSGYMGGDESATSYKEVSTGRTGRAETVKITYDPSKTTYEKLARLFFEIHDPTQVNRQGPDIGTQYRSVVFYTSDEQKKTAEKLIGRLEKKGYDVATQIEPAGAFATAEGYHQDYYDRKGGTPYCHIKTERFDD